MAFNLFSLFVVVLCVTQAWAIIICRPPRRIPCIPINVTPPTPFTTPSMVDGQSLNFTHPSIIAKDCLNSLGQSIVGMCQTKAEADWDPAKMNTSTSTTWETCCALFEELDCYVKNAGSFCPAATRNALQAYSRKVASYFSSAICRSIQFDNWQNGCTNATHQQIAQNANTTFKNDPDFVKLPKDDGPEKACFTKLRSAVLPNNTKVNLEQQCQTSALDKWDPARQKIVESGVIDSCCAIYDALDCIQQQANSTCSSSEQTDLATYRQKSVAVFGQTICKTVPYEQAQKLCYGKTSGANSLNFTSAIFSLTGAVILLVISNL